MLSLTLNRALVPVLVVGGLNLAGAAPQVHDTSLDRKPRAVASVVPTQGPEHVLYTPDALPVRVQVSASYPINPTAEQQLVNFLATRLHGPELGRLRVFVATPQEIGFICGEREALACYWAPGRQMFVPGETPPPGFVPREYIVTHEYGHHVAASRRNDPWPAETWGPKLWASHMHVCQGMRDGDLGHSYDSIPSEGFAQTYATLHYPGLVQWLYSPLLEPDAGALQAVHHDVTRPWRGPSKRHYSGRSLASRRIIVRTPLDGAARFSVRGPRGSRLALTVTARGGTLTRSKFGGSRVAVRVRVCGQRRLRVRVSGTARRPFSLNVSRP